jgi:AcrR family transcriptional regulator
MGTQTTFASLNQEARKAKQQIIIDAAEGVFASKPFNQVSMRDIAGAAGISHATIYRYFPDKQALFVEAFLRGVTEILESIEATDHKEPGEAISAVAELFVDFLFTNDHYFKMMSHFMLHGELKQERIDRLNTMVRPLLDRFEMLFKELGAETDTRLLAHCLFSALNGILITFRDYPGRSKEDVARHIKRLSRMTACLFKDGALHSSRPL